MECPSLSLSALQVPKYLAGRCDGEGNVQTSDQKGTAESGLTRRTEKRVHARSNPRDCQRMLLSFLPSFFHSPLTSFISLLTSFLSPFFFIYFPLLSSLPSLLFSILYPLSSPLFPVSSLSSLFFALSYLRFPLTPSTLPSPLSPNT
ncbi:unnamed protein product [Protopolystoma xenopodis]|uniref:Transmembrane protein n=1 Tax=Protopolystoma xenopodis TaxID=117903 RepID=A0A3S5CLZ9_9PLAT|nr:unnamed protein product [Protopolystoma xenopodis]